MHIINGNLNTEEEHEWVLSKINAPLINAEQGSLHEVAVNAQGTSSQQQQQFIRANGGDNGMAPIATGIYTQNELELVQKGVKSETIIKSKVMGAWWI